MVIFFLLTRNARFDLSTQLDYNLLQVLPYLVVLVGALIGINVFLVLVGGTVLSLAVGVGTGTIVPAQMFQMVAEGPDGSGGIMGMYDITVISIVVACIVALVKEMGGIHFILSFIRKRIRGKKGGELGIAALALLVDLCTANNTVAIVMAGPIAREISEEYEIETQEKRLPAGYVHFRGTGTDPLRGTAAAGGGLYGTDAVSDHSVLHLSDADGSQRRGIYFIRKKPKGEIMRTFEKSSKLDNVLYDVRGPVVDEAAKMEANGLSILKLNIGNPAPFGFSAPEEVILDMRQSLWESQGYSDSKDCLPPERRSCSIPAERNSRRDHGGYLYGKRRQRADQPLYAGFAQ